MSPAAITKWFESYGRAWEARDPIAFSELFSAEAWYYWGPFREPQRGRVEIESAVRTAFSGQSDVRFNFRLLSGATAPYVAHWMCKFIRVASGRLITIDGIFVLQFDAHGHCEEFREWWHSDELENNSVGAAPNNSVDR